MVASTRPVEPVSDRKRVANQLNAQKSTGPRSPEGKARSSKNAVSHGLFAQDILVVGEDPGEFKSYRLNMLRRLDPRDEFEMEYAEQFISAGWKLKRLRAAECHTYDARITNSIETIRSIRPDAQPRPDHAPRLLASDLSLAKSEFERFQRYEIRLQNMMNRAHKQLRLLQKESRQFTLSTFSSKIVDQEEGWDTEIENEPTADVTSEPDTSYAPAPLPAPPGRPQPMNRDIAPEPPRPAPARASDG